MKLSVSCPSSQCVTMSLHVLNISWMHAAKSATRESQRNLFMSFPWSDSQPCARLTLKRVRLVIRHGLDRPLFIGFLRVIRTTDVSHPFLSTRIRLFVPGNNHTSIGRTQILGWIDRNSTNAQTNNNRSTITQRNFSCLFSSKMNYEKNSRPSGSSVRANVWRPSVCFTTFK